MPPKIRAIVAPPFSVTEADAAFRACSNYTPPHGTSWKAAAQHRAADKLADLLRAHRQNEKQVTLPVETYENGQPKFAADGTMLDEAGNRSIFDDVDQ